MAVVVVEVGVGVWWRNGIPHVQNAGAKVTERIGITNKQAGKDKQASQQAGSGEKDAKKKRITSKQRQPRTCEKQAGSGEKDAKTAELLVCESHARSRARQRQAKVNHN